MKLINAKLESDWNLAHEIILDVIENLDSNGKSLWTRQQADINELKQHYRLDELYFLHSENITCGMVFIQSEDPLFWPEVKTGGSYFIHKLAVVPQCKGQQYGYKILDLVLELARANGIDYLRLDCDPRAELMHYYQNYGFSLVSQLMVGEYPVVKYELPTHNAKDLYS
jgi:GNAT superfamily N-acetyltransferase